MSKDAEKKNQVDPQLHEHVGSASDESRASPNLTLLETGQNPGSILKVAREKLGLEINELSAKTKINANQILAIEAGDLDRLPPATFAKAFIKSYCKVVSVDPEPILLAFGFQPQSHEKKGGKQLDRTAPTFEPKMPKNSRRLSSLSFDRRSGSKKAGTVIALVALALFAIVYLPEFFADSGNDLTPQGSVVELSNQAGDETPILVPAPEQRNLETLPTEPGVVRESLPLAIDPASEVSGPETTESVFPAIREQQQRGKSTEFDSVQSVGGSVETDDAKATTEDVAFEPETPVSSSPSVGSTQPVQVTKPGESVLQFVFDEESWVTVRDARDRVLMSRLNQAGQQASVQGQPPFNLIVGKAQTVTLLHDGEPVDLSPHIRGEVARLTVD